MLSYHSYSETQGLSGINVDLFENSPSWVNYIYFILPLFAGVATAWIIFRYGRSLIKRVFHSWRKRSPSDTEHLPLLDNTTVLAWAAQTGQIDLLGLTLGARSSEHEEGGASDDPLIAAIQHGQVETANLLLQDQGSDVNRIDARGLTAMHYAARSNNPELLRLILSANPRLDIQSRDGNTPLDLAIQSGSEACAAMLLRAELHLETPAEELPVLTAAEDEHLSAMHCVCYIADFVLFNDLLRHGFKTERRYNGRTPLFSAVASRNIAFLKHVVSSGLNISAVDNDGLGVIHIAVAISRPDAVKILLDAGANVNALSATKLTPLHCIDVSDEKAVDVMKVMAGRGAMLNATDDEGIRLSTWPPETCPRDHPSSKSS